jgi:hypothetical protein
VAHVFVWIWGSASNLISAISSLAVLFGFVPYMCISEVSLKVLKVHHKLEDALHWLF